MATPKRKTLLRKEPVVPAEKAVADMERLDRASDAIESGADPVDVLADLDEDRETDAVGRPLNVEGELELIRNDGPIGITAVTGNWRCYIGQEQTEKQIAVWMLMGDGTVVPGISDSGQIVPATDVRAIKDPMGVQSNANNPN